VLVPPAKNDRTVRQHWRRAAQRFRGGASKYRADWRILLWVGLVLSPVVAVICAAWLARSPQPLRRDVRPVDAIVAPAVDHNNDGYVEGLRPIIRWTEP